jgi:polar amino acid transport system permease protein
MSIWVMLVRYREALLAGLAVTIKLFLFVSSMGVGLGILFGALGYRYEHSFGVLVRGISFILSGIPILVLLFWVHYPSQALLGIVVDPFKTSVFVLTLLNVFAVADIVMESLREFPRQYIVAAKVCGLSARETFRSIQLPIISRQLIPVLLPIQVYMLHATLFASLISTEEIFRTVQRINAIEYKPVQIYSALALFFLAICLPLNALALFLKHRYTRNISEN